MTSKEEEKEALEGLIKKGLVIQTKFGYQLTPLGRMVADKLDEQDRGLLN